MNYLAHLYLSGNDEQIIFGNFIGDSIKGSKYNDFPQKIKEGILLHRKIDDFMDTHPIVRVGILRLRERYSKYAGVVIDIFYDHLLAESWENHSDESLRDFSKRMYSILESQYDEMPDRAQRFFSYMKMKDLLFNYKNIKDIDEVLWNMSRRIKNNSGIETAAEELVSQKVLFHQEFEQFFKQIKNEVGVR